MGWRGAASIREGATLTVTCDDCNQALHRVGRGNQPAFETRVPCLNKACPTRPEEEPVQDDEYQLALSHLRETRAA